MITLLRQHYQYDLLTSRAYQTTIISTIKYDSDKPSLFFMPANDILENLEIKDSQGRHLTVLSEKELLDEFGIDKHEMLGKAREDGIETTEGLDVIPILCLPSESKYEKIFITYTVPIKKSRYALKRVSPNIEINFRFKVLPYEMFWKVPNYELANKPFELHILVNVGDDYRINGEPVVHVYPEGDREIQKVKEARFNTFGYYIGDMRFDNVVMGHLRIGLTGSLLNTAKIISGITMILPILLVSLPIFTGKIFDPTLEILGGSIALLIGERFWVLKDRYIMTRWIHFQYGLIILNGGAFVLWYYMQQTGYVSIIMP